MDISQPKASINIFNTIKKYSHEEYQYLHLIEKITKISSCEHGRNGNTLSIFGETMRFSLINNKIPILTTKKTAWKTCLKELLWFIHGDTDNKLLQKENVHIWDANSTREFLDSRGLTDYPEGILGPIYGRQWRNFDASYNNLDGTALSKGIDQLQYIIDSLNNPKERTSRRLIMTAWNPNQLNIMALPPCHVLCQFNIHDTNKLSCSLYARSQDLPLGTPFNIASYAFLTHLLAKHCDLIAHEIIIFMGNCHIYEEHIEDIKVILEREPFEFPTLEILNKRPNIDSYNIEDFVVHNYNSHPIIKMKMIA
jgi:thymidylate synthase